MQKCQNRFPAVTPLHVVRFTSITDSCVPVQTLGILAVIVIEL